MALALESVASGRWTIAAAAWLAPIFLVRVMRSQGWLKAYLLGAGVLAFGGAVGWRGVVPGVGEGWIFLAVVFVAGLIETLPFLADRLGAPRLGGLPATLVLPTAFVAFHFLWAFVAPSTGFVTYSLFGSDPLVQLVSVAGVWGPAFLVMWVAAAVNLLWEQGFRLAPHRGPVVAPFAILSLLVLPRELDEGFENKAVVVTPDGDVATEYLKARPVPGLEARYMRAGDGRLAVFDTRYGRVGLAICYDLDYVRDMRQVGREGVDILIGPALTWPAIARLHMEMATFRSVEHGVSLLRSAQDGISAATDPHGRVVARMDDSRSATRTLTAEVPTRGVSTFYSMAGDWLGWLSIAGLLGLVGMTWRGRVSRAAPQAAAQEGSVRDPPVTD